MGDISAYFNNIRNSAVSIFEGMAVTLSWMFRKPPTIQYPDRVEKPVKETLPERFRGILEVDISICTACSACTRACPIDVILLESGKAPDGKGRLIRRFDIDAAKCMYCGFCTEACPTGAIRHSAEFEASTRDIRNLVLHFVETPVAPYKPVKDVEPQGAPRGTIVSKLIKPWYAPYQPFVLKELPVPAPESVVKAEEAVAAAKPAAPKPEKAVPVKEVVSSAVEAPAEAATEGKAGEPVKTES